MTPQEHLAAAQEHLRLAERYNPPAEENIQAAIAHANVGMLAQAVQDSDAVVGQMNASLQSVRNALIRKQAEGR